MTKVSIIIPVYNVAPYLKEALDSVINQTYKNIEIIIIDDGSTDGSGKVCDEYTTDSRVRVIHQDNQGLSSARNTGLDHATGDYIAFLDPDDAYHSEMIERMIYVIIKKNADLVACSYIIKETEGSLVDSKGIRIVGFEKNKKYTSREAITAQLEGRFDEAAWNKLYKRELWENERFPDGHIFEDMQVMPLIYERCNSIMNISDVLVFHRARKGSITNTRTLHIFKELFYAYSVLLNYIDYAEPSFSNKTIRIFHGNVFQVLAIRWLEFLKQEGNTKEVNLLKNDIISYVDNELSIKTAKAKTIWILFKFCPNLLPILRLCYKKIKRMMLSNERGRAYS